jgi:hypothetical protein
VPIPKSPRSQGGVSWPTAILLALVCAAVSAVLVVLLTWSPTPGPLAQSQSRQGTVSIAKQPYDDARDVDLSVTRGAAGQLLATASGTLTSSTCQPGLQISSGEAFATVGERPVVPLATRTPAYRDIEPATTGRDVDTLRAELARLQVVPSAEPASAPAGKELISKARALAGLESPDSADLSLPRTAFAWLPATTATIESCDVPVGADVSTGVALVTLAPPITQVRVATVPSDAIRGNRVLAVGNAEVTLTNGTTATGRALARLLKADAWQIYQQSNGEVPIVGQWRLETPLEVASIPPSSLVTTGRRACVSVSGKPQPVTIAASSLGRTLVTFDSLWPGAIDAAPSPELTC